MNLIRLLFGLAICATFSYSPSHANADDSPDELIEKLLATHWEKSGANKAAAQLIYESDRQLQNHPKVMLAYSINRMQHNRQRDALAIVKRLNQVEASNADAWMLRIWLEALTDNYDQSLVAITQFRQNFSQPDKIDPETQKELHLRLGRVIGYMQGPVNHKINPDILAAALAAAIDGMTPNQLQRFNSERNKVLAKFDALSKTNAAKLADEKLKVQINNDLEADKRQKQNKDLQDQASQLMPLIDKARADADDQINNLRAEISPLESQQVTIGNQITDLKSDLSLMYSDLIRLQTNWPNHPDIIWIAANIRNRERDLSGLYRQSRDVAARINQLGGRMRQVRAMANSRIHSLNQQLKQLELTRRKNDRRLNQLSKGPKVATGKKLALDNRVISLKTYDPFPLELYRVAMVEKLTK